MNALTEDIRAASKRVWKGEEDLLRLIPGLCLENKMKW
jgi:hypothetical protein